VEKKNKRQKKSNDKAALLPTDLKDKCAETVASAANAVDFDCKDRRNQEQQHR
jgi:hypothetical protein